MSQAWTGGSDTRWRTFRAGLIAQWAQQGRRTCEVGLAGCTRQVEQVDHIQPLHKGGAKYDPLNCRPACARCNAGRPASAALQPQPRPVSQW